MADSVARAQTVISAGADVGQFLNASTGGVPNWSASSYRFALGGNARWNTANQFNTAGHLSLDVDGRGSVVTRAGNNVFTLNSSTLDGATISLRDLTFSQTSNSSAGIFRDTGGTHTVNVNLERVTFNGLAGAFGNAFYMNGTTDRTVMVINAGTGTNGVTFSNNTSTGDGGGVISMYGGTMTFNGDYTFDTNTTANYGGAIAMYQNNGIMTFNGATTFRNNRANNYFGGAIDIWGGASTLTFNGASTFTGNYVVSNSTGAGNPRGGAINIGYTSPGSGASVVRFNAPVTFDGNYVVSTGGGGSAYGGAISAYGNGAAYNYQYIFTAPALFQNNYAIKTGSGNGAGNGGAIYYDASGASLSLAAGTRFLNNASSHLGGAIFLQSGTITLDADTGDTLFQGNRHGAQFDGSYRPVAGTGTPNAIYLGSSGTLNFIADAGRRIEFFDPIASSSGSLVTVNKSGDGEVVFHGDDGATGNYVSAITANTTVSGGTFTLDRGAGYGVRTAGIFSVGAATLRGGSSSTLRALALNIGGSSRLEVAGGLFTVDAGTITTQAGTAIAGSGTLASTGAITLGGIAQVTVADGNNLAITGVLGGTGGFALGGGGTLVLSGTRNSYTGATGIAAATTLVAGATNALGNSRNVNVDGLFDMSQGNFSQFAGNLTGGGEIRLGSATLTASNTADTTFAGTISGTGALAKTGSGALTLAGANTFSGGLSISAGTVAGNDMQAFGTGDIVNNGTLRLDFASDQAFTNQLSGSGRLVTNGAGTLSFDHDARQGDVSVNAGTLSLQGEAAFSAASLTTAAGAAITLADDSSLTLTNALTQASGASLNLILGNPSVTAGNASIDGTLNVIGFAPTIPYTASGLTGAAFRVLHTTGGIAGDFSTVAFGGPVAALDYLQPTGVKSGNGLDYFVALSLSWNGGATRGHGTFTLADAADAFDVDVALTDQAASATGWNGRDLTKNGSGTLTLSAQNTYTGLTNVNGGTLAMGIANAMAGSSDVTLAAGTALTLNDFSQTANNLTGAGAIHLGTAAPTTLTANNATDGTLSGVIDGAGAFAKAGTGTLTLTGANTYAGGTTVSGGTLIGLNIGAFGTGAIANNAALRFDFADDNTVANTLSGTGSLTKNGAGTVTITAPGQQGDVSVNAGGLRFSQSGVFQAASFSATDGVATTLDGSAQLAVTGAFTHAANATLNVALDANDPAITAASAAVAGTLNITGFSGSVPQTASALVGTRFTILRTTDGITGDFGAVNLSGSASTVDYVVVGAQKSTDNLEYIAGFGLTWRAGTTRGHGTFTLADAADAFDVDVALADQATSATGWNGRDLTKNGSGTLTLSAQNTYTGLTNVNGGTLAMGIANAMAGSSDVTLAAGTALTLNDFSQTANNLTGAGAIHLGTAAPTTLTANNATDGTLSGVIDGAGTFAKAGPGTLTLTGANTYAGGTTVSGGTLIGLNIGAFGTGAIANNAALRFDFADDNTVANALSGTGSLTKNGAGTVTIAASGQQGDVTLNAGGLHIDGTTAFTASNYTAGAGTTTTIAGNAQLNVTNAYTQAGDSTLQFILGNPFVAAGSANLDGKLNIIGFAPGTPSSASALTSTQFTVLHTTDGITGDFSDISFSGAASQLDFLLPAGSLSADSHDYNIGLSLAWNAGATQGNGIFTLATPAGSFDVDVALADQAASATGWNGRDLTKNGAGTLTLSALNTYTGLTTVNGGTLSMGIANAIASSSAVAVNPGATLAFNDQSQTLNNLSGTGTISLGTAGATMLTASNTTDTTFAGTIGGAGGLTKTGTGTLTLSGSNSYAGGTTIGDGTLRATQGAVFGSGIVTNNAALQLDFATDSTLANTLAGAGSLTKTGTGVATTTASGSQGDIAVNAGTLRFGQTGVFQAESLGTADGATTTIDGGAQLSVAGTFTKSANATLNVALDANEPVISAGSATVAGTLNITGFSASVPQTASALTGTRFTILRTTGGIAGDFSAVNLSGSSSAVDYILVGAQKSADNLEYIAGFGLTWRAGTTRSNGAFTLAGASDTFDVDVVLADQAASATGWNGRDLTKNGAGTLTLSALNTYTGLTTVNGGTLSMGIANAIASSSAVAVNAGATLAFNDQSQTLNNLSGAGTISLGTAGATMLTASNTTDTTFAGTIGGAGGLTKTGTGTLTLSGSNSYAGGTTIGDGTLRATQGAVFGSGIVTNNAALQLDFATDSTLANTLAGAGSLTKTGTGVATIAATGSQGDIAVNAGTLRFGQTGVFQAESLGTADGATTTIDGGAQLSVAGAFTKSANATLNVALDANEPVISAGSATVTGTLNITGFSASVPQTASALTGTRFTILRTTGGIAGDFSAVNLSGSSSAVDYILVGAQKSADNLEYIAGFGLTWRAGTTRSNGAFTLAGASDTFNVDVVLADQAASATGWNGRDLTKNGAGTLTLSALNTYTGLTTVNGGTLSMGIANAIASSSAVSVNAGATLAFNDQSQTLNNLSGTGTISLGTAGATMLTASNTTDTTFAGTIGGAGGLTKTGSGTLTLSGSNSYTGGTTIASGALAGHADSFGPGNILNHGALLIDAPVTATMGQAISGTGALVKSGSGMLELTGISNLSGPTSVNGGRLAVNGFLGNSAVTLATGTAIQGIGTVGALHVNAAAVEPGNSIGTLHVNGAYTQGNGGRYIAEVNPESDTSSDRIEVQGKATLEPGAVLVPTRTALSGFSINARYLVLSATEGITGTYTMADDGRGSFYLLQDEYDGYNVYLKTRMYRSFASAAITPNQIATAGALESLPESNPLRDAVGRLNTDDEARAAFDMLSGEIHASVKSALLTDSRYLRDTATDRLRQNGCLPASGEHIATMQDVAMPQANGADCAALDARPQAWARTFGTYDRINGDGNAARMTQNLFGFLVGADATVAPGWRAGALAGYSHGRQSAGDRNSSANTDNYHLGLYGGTSWRNLGIRLGALASWHEIDTTRTPVFTGFHDQLKSNYGARTLQAFTDVGYRFALGKMDMEPFANAAFVNLHGNSFNEGSSAAALSADTANDNLTVTTLGLRSALSMETQAGHAWGVTLMAGWQHTFGNDFPLRTMRFAGSAPFTVAGVPVARDAAVVEGGVNARIGSRTWLGFSYSGRFGSHASSQTIQGKLAIRW